MFDGLDVSGRWNPLWKTFIDAEDLANPYTQKQVYQFGGSLMDQFGLGNLPNGPY